MGKQLPLAIWAALIVLIGLISAVGTKGIPNLGSMSSNEAAAWTQAIGSVLAIIISGLIAVYVPRHHEDVSLKNRQALGVRLTYDLYGELLGYLGSIKSIATSKAINSGTCPHISQAVRSALADLNGIPALELPGTFRIHLISARSDIDLALVFLSQADEKFRSGVKVPSDFFDGPIAQCEKNRDKVLAYIKANPVGKNSLLGYL